MDELTIEEHYRFEGVSDPEDMPAVSAMERHDGTRGIIADAFGVYTDPNLRSPRILTREIVLGYLESKKVDQMRENNVFLLVHGDHMITIVQ